MRFVTILLYSLKLNVLNIVVQNLRTNLLDMLFIESSVVNRASVCSPEAEEYPGDIFGNTTEVPVI